MNVARNTTRRVPTLAIALIATALVACEPQKLATMSSSDGFMPHGHCYLWNPGLVWLHVASDLLIGVSYVVISSLLVNFVRKRQDLPFDWMFIAFGLFIVACGVGHFLDVLTLWNPLYWLSGAERGATAFVSVLTAILLVPLLPKAMALPSPEQLRLANVTLQAEIAERKEAEARLAAKAQELEAAMQLLREQQEALIRSEKLATVGQLAASVGHELRNPLAAVRNAAAYISKRVLGADGPPITRTDPKVKDFFGIIDRELNTSGKIITDLLDFAREREPVLQPCPLHPLVAEAIDVVIKGDVRVENRVAIDLPTPHLDRDQFRQVLINLIQNAVDVTPPRSDHPVTVEAEGGKGEPLTVRVSDKGCGIPDNLQTKIFEPLFTTKTKGTGLGLAIVQSIVRNHKGDVAATSRVDAGTTFTITLPASPAPAEGVA